MSDPYALFLHALNSPVTRERYSTRLRYFLTKIGLTGNDTNNDKRSIVELCKTFVEKGKQDPNWIINNIVAFFARYKGTMQMFRIPKSLLSDYVSSQFDPTSKDRRRYFR
jgi:hypothetical protein